MGSLLDLARSGVVVVSTREYTKSGLRSTAARTVFCADGSLIQMFADEALRERPEVIEAHQRTVRAQLQALSRKLLGLRVAAEGLAVGVGVAIAAWQLDVREWLRSVVVGAVSVAGWAIARWAVRRALRYAVGRAVRGWLGDGAAG